MNMPQMMAGSVSSWACSPKVAGSSVAPLRGMKTARAAQVRTASASVPSMATCQPTVSARIFPTEVAMTMATENAA